MIAGLSRRHVLLSSVALVGALALPGCASKKETDQTIDKMIGALADGDKDDFEKLLTSSAKDELDDEKFDALSGAIKELGKFEDRTMKNIEIANGDIDANYVLEFKKGSVKLYLSIIDGKIAGFQFNGSDFEDAMEAAQKGGDDDEDDDDDDDDDEKKKKKKSKKKDDD